MKGILSGPEDFIVTINANKNLPGYACNKAMASLYVAMQLQLIPRIAYISKCTTSHNELDLNNGNIKINQTYNNQYTITIISELMTLI